MNKKIKTLVQKYEKDMQFENRFEDLKDKLDLIPDQNNTNEVYVIRKKLMPAYVMTIVLLMLVTGIIGLQLGLNSNYITGPERVDVIEEELSDLVDVFERESIESVQIDSNVKVQIYLGIIEGKKVLIFRLDSKVQYTTTIIQIESLNIVLNDSNYLGFISVENTQDISIDFNLSYLDGVEKVKSINRDYSLSYTFLGF